MRKIIQYAALAAMCALAACSDAQVAKVQALNAATVSVAKAVCKVDGQVQPIVVPLSAAVATAVVPSAAGPIAGAVALDTNVVHPAIVKACAGINATAVGVVEAVPAATAQ